MSVLFHEADLRPMDITRWWVCLYLSGKSFVLGLIYVFIHSREIRKGTLGCRLDFFPRKMARGFNLDIRILKIGPGEESLPSILLWYKVRWISGSYLRTVLEKNNKWSSKQENQRRVEESGRYQGQNRGIWTNCSDGLAVTARIFISSNCMCRVRPSEGVRNSWAYWVILIKRSEKTKKPREDKCRSLRVWRLRTMSLSRYTILL